MGVFLLWCSFDSCGSMLTGPSSRSRVLLPTSGPTYVTMIRFISTEGNRNRIYQTSPDQYSWSLSLVGIDSSWCYTRSSRRLWIHWLHMPRHRAHYAKTCRRHPQNRKYIMYRSTALPEEGVATTTGNVHKVWTVKFRKSVKQTYTHHYTLHSFGVGGWEK